jgi:hypothetical protein
MAAAAIYLLCTLTCAGCFVLLMKAWVSTRHGMLFWCALSFGGMTVNNALLVADKLLLPDMDLSTQRLLLALAALLLLVYGLIWTEE